ncbi:RNase H1/viroplasmin domain-containing protein, partial [Nocardioides sp.]|uniref:RNase H1/viroplasmin domain-containing protein n=1 Tax=Nocardioides sp. TaxID=35761 RepID=UPI0027367454
MTSGNKFYAYLVPARRLVRRKFTEGGSLGEGRPRTGKSGVADDWEKCRKIVSGEFGARYKGFKTRDEAEKWLELGADYRIKRTKKLEPGIYFDAGTGRGQGVEISVTDENGKNLLHKTIPKNELNRFGKYLLDSDATNNYGELLAMSHAIEIAGKKMNNRTAEQCDIHGSRVAVIHPARGRGLCFPRRNSSLPVRARCSCGENIKKVFGDSKLVIDYWSKWRFKRNDLPEETVELAENVSRLRSDFEKRGGV